ncbi:response regulator transcription factor [Variovorax rhizosphaerae]|uniref:Response regulator n=1 Tax=Variovorax rhizosphaerae TaxID=1836200 RepID=A0ABU8WIC6_9BURK
METMPELDTVFLVDDDPSVCKSLTRVLRGEGWRVHSFTSAEAFLTRPDPRTRGCLVLDVTMPGLDGLELQHRLMQTGHPLPIVFLSGHGDIPMTVQAIKAGAADFLTKPVSAATLVEAVRRAVAQDASTCQANAEAAACEARLATLTAREREVLAAVVKGRLNKQIANDLGIVEQTVKFHRARIMERMQTRTVAELMHVAAKLGW